MTCCPAWARAPIQPTVRAGIRPRLTLLLVPGIMPLVSPAPEAGLVAAGHARRGGDDRTLARLVGASGLSRVADRRRSSSPICSALSTVLQPDPELGGHRPLHSLRCSQIIAPLTILVSGLYALPLSALAGSYRLIPPGALLPSGDGAAMAVTAVAPAFALALRLASPFVLAAIVWHVAIGLMARLVPRLQVYFIAMPGQILGGLVLLVGLGGALLAAWQDAVRDSLATLPGN